MPGAAHPWGLSSPSAFQHLPLLLLSCSPCPALRLQLKERPLLCPVLSVPRTPGLRPLHPIAPPGWLRQGFSGSQHPCRGGWVGGSGRVARGPCLLPPVLLAIQAASGEPSRYPMLPRHHHRSSRLGKKAPTSPCAVGRPRLELAPGAGPRALCSLSYPQPGPGVSSASPSPRGQDTGPSLPLSDMGRLCGVGWGAPTMGSGPSPERR